MITAFLIQNIFFEKLKSNQLNIKVFKILSEALNKKFILIESIKEDNSNQLARQFNIILYVFPNSFNYSALSEIFVLIGNALSSNDFKNLEGFVNFKFLNSFVYSNKGDGFHGKIEFACFFTKTTKS